MFGRSPNGDPGAKKGTQNGKKVNKIAFFEW